MKPTFGMLCGGGILALAAGLFFCIPEQEEVEDETGNNNDSAPQTPIPEQDIESSAEELQKQNLQYEEWAEAVDAFKSYMEKVNVEELQKKYDTLAESVDSLKEDVDEAEGEMAAVDAAITGFSEALEMVCDNLKNTVSSEHLGAVIERINSINEMVDKKIDHPTEIIVSPEAIPDHEKDAEILKTLNETIQDLHQRIQKSEIAIRSLIESDMFTQKAIDDLSSAVGSIEDSLADSEEDKGKLTFPIHVGRDEKETFEEETFEEGEEGDD